jgi:hypothetical protein
MMVINDTLAKGLKNRFWSELDSNYDKATIIIERYKTNHKIKLRSRRGIDKFDFALRSGYGKSLLAAYKSGSRNSPLMRYALLAGIKNTVNEWDEKTFHIIDMAFNVYGQTKYYPTMIRVGEHAVSRVFQRHPQIYNVDTKEFEIMKIIPEFQALAMYGHLMYGIIKGVGINNEHMLQSISLPFVTESGIFLGSYNIKEDLLDVRTFIADRQLSPKQSALATSLREHFSTNYSPVMPFIFHEMLSADNFPIEMIAFYAALSKVGLSFAELATWNESNPERKKQCQGIIIQFLKSMSEISLRNIQ